MKYSGFVILGLIFMLFISCFQGLILNPEMNFSLLQSSYFLAVFTFTIKQALLSTLISIAFGTLFSLSLNRQRSFITRKAIISLLGLPFILPVIIAIYGIITVYGNSGWLGCFLKQFNINHYNIYGLTGILITHAFFNIPLATKVFLHSLETIPKQNMLLAHQLGLPTIAYFRYIEWPKIKNLIPGIASLIFMICFTSFAIALTLGGGPNSTTIEVAIYQALIYEFDHSSAALLAITQLTICLIILIIFHNKGKIDFFSARSLPSKTHFLKERNKYWDFGIITLLSGFILLPLLSISFIVFDLDNFIKVLISKTVHLSIIKSFFIGISTAFISHVFAIFFIYTYINLKAKNKKNSYNELYYSSIILIFAIPTFVLGTGLYIAFYRYMNIPPPTYFFVILLNAISCLPFVLKILKNAIVKSHTQYSYLYMSLGISKWNCFKYVYYPQLQKPLCFSIGLSFALGFGDLGTIILFGNESTQTLSILLYNAIGSYRLEYAQGLSLIFLSIVLLVYILINSLINKIKFH